MGLKELVKDLETAKEVAKTTNHKISAAEQAIEDHLLKTDQFYCMIVKFRDEVQRMSYDRRYDSTAHLEEVRGNMVTLLNAKIARYKSDIINKERGILPSPSKIHVMGDVYSPIEFVNGSFQSK